MKYQLEILFWTILGIMALVSFFIVKKSIYLLIRDGPFINETHIFYYCFKTKRVHPQELVMDIIDDQETVSSEELKEYSPDDQI